MKLQFTCLECFRKNIDTIDFVQIDENNIYTYKCINHHKNYFVLQDEKFELLIESAVYAIIDGYYREAVSTFAASLERTYEFVIEILCKKYGISDELYRTTWNSISKNSERQYGAFVFLYAQEFNSLPATLNNSKVEFRNNVIHKGLFPSYTKTIDYGQNVLNTIFDIIYKLRIKHENIIREVLNERIKNMIYESEKQQIEYFPVLTPNTINIHHSVDSFKQINLENYIEKKRLEIKITKS